MFCRKDGNWSAEVLKATSGKGKVALVNQPFSLYHSNASAGANVLLDPVGGSFWKQSVEALTMGKTIEVFPKFVGLLHRRLLQTGDGCCMA
jgi:hypothetical protein